jgi:shikimate kinase
MNVFFLIGFMGVGKSSLGRQVASSIDAQFLDTDFEIEKLHQSKIALLLDLLGEAWFREQENALLTKIALRAKTEECGRLIVSCGGGFPCFNNNMQQMNQIGTTIYLQLPAEELFHRLKDKREKRPLLRDLTESELTQKITSMLEQRELFYLQASSIVSLSGKSMFNAYKAVLEAVKFA